MAQADPNDLYAALGVPKTATEAELKKAYRKLAKELHPDLTGGDKAKAERFKTVSAAWDILRDPEKRRRYDAGEIDSEGQERAQPRDSYRSYAEQGDASGRYEFEGGFDDLGEMFSRAFRGRAGRGGAGAGAGAGGGSPFGQGFAGAGGADFSHMKMRGADVRFHLEVSFLDAANGATKALTLPGAGHVDLHIPAGVEDGQTLRLTGKGEAGANGGPAGDAYVTVTVAPDPVFTREGDDVRLEVPISIDEAVLGGSVEVPTLTGRARLKVPANSSSGRTLRLRGKGVLRRGAAAAGDLLVTLRIVLPEHEDAELTQAIRNWRAKNFYDPRADWKGSRT